MSAKEKPKPEEDGVTHINVYSKGRTELGRLLSNFAHTPFQHPEHGFFASMEAYWYWCSSGRTHDELRRLFGSSAKAVGLKCDPVPIPEEEFHDMIREGIRLKILQNDHLRRLLASSKLPFEHYYVFGQKNDVVVDKPEHRWQLDTIEEVRKTLTAELAPPQPEQ